MTLAPVCIFIFRFEIEDCGKACLCENEDIPESCASCLVKLQVRVASDNVGVPGSWTDWYGPDGVGTYFTISKGEIAPKEFNWASWAQYKIEMQSDEINTPIVYDIIVNYK